MENRKNKKEIPEKAAENVFLAEFSGYFFVPASVKLQSASGWQKETDGRKEHRMKRKQNEKNRQGQKLVLLILPFLILCFLFSYFPLHGWIYAFYDYRAPLKLSQCEFVGLKWFRMLFANPMQVRQLLQVLKNTFAMSFLGIAFSFLPVLFAVFLNEIKCRWFRNLVQTITTVPNFISWTLVYAVAFALFSSTGMVNSVLQQMGIIDHAVKFLDSSNHEIGRAHV